MSEQTPQNPLEEAAEPAAKQPKLDKNGKPKKSLKREIVEWILTIAAAVAIALVIRTLIFEPVKVDGASMNDTLQNGEIMYVSKPEYVFGDGPQRFDVVILHYPDRGWTNFVKRIVGIPGDTVQFIDGYLYVNGEKQDEPYINDAYRTSFITDTNPIYVPKKGDTLTLEQFGSSYYVTINGETWQGSSLSIGGKASDGSTLELDNGTVTYNGITVSESNAATVFAEIAAKSFEIDEDYFFVCGDHRNNSNDSRSVGPIRRSYIKGHVKQVIWPFSAWRGVE